MRISRRNILRHVLDIFAFTHDIRPGLFWRVLIYLFLFLIVLGLTQSARLSLLERSLSWPETTAGAFYLFAGSAGMLAVTALSRRFLDRRPWQGIALPAIWKGGSHILLGWLAGCGLIAILFVIEYMLGWIRIEGNEVAASGWGVALDWIVSGILLKFTIGFTEEIAFRGYIFQNMAEKFPLWLALILTGILFAIVHGNQGSGYFVSVLLISAFLSMTRLGTRSLWFAIAFHGGWDWMQSEVLGIMNVNKPNYGHALLHVSQHGPGLFAGRAPAIEGGLLALLLAAFAFVCAWSYAKRRQPAINWHIYLADTGELLTGES